MAKQTWKTSHDLLSEIQATYSQLRDGELPVEEARALATLLKQGIKIVELEIEHARMTGRLKDGDRSLPSFERSDEPAVATDRKRKVA